jgi:hypothetical protein
MRLQGGAAAGVRAVFSGGLMSFVDNQVGGGFMELGGAGGAYKTFVIDHPLDDPARPRRVLVHACVEGPEAAVFYRGRAEIRDGIAWVDLPPYFDALTVPGSATVQVTVQVPDKPELPAKPEHEVIPRAAASAPREGRFRIMSDGPDGTQVVWVVHATRADVPALVVEPLRDEVTVRGDGPYTWIDPPGPAQDGRRRP